jgi:hypothetical protein
MMRCELSSAKNGFMVMQNEFHRIRRLPPYVFEEVNRLKAEARARGEPDPVDGDEEPADEE